KIRRDRISDPRIPTRHYCIHQRGEAMHSHDMTRRLFLGSLGATLGLPELQLQAQGQTPAPAAANVEKDVVYGKGGDTDLHLDIYKPTGAANKRMAIVHYHGGGFQGGSKD